MNNSLLYALAVPTLAASGFLAGLKVFADHRTQGWVYRLLVGVGLVSSGSLLISLLFQEDGLHFGFVTGLLCVSWLIAFSAFIESFFSEVPVMDMLVYPFCALMLLLSLGLGDDRVIKVSATFLFQIHLLIALAAYSLLGVAAVHSVVMAFQEKALHQPVTTLRESRGLKEKLLDQLPSLLTMESILFRQLWIGFSLLTLTLVSGFLFAEEVFGSTLKFDHKTLFAVLSWLSFAVLLGGRVLMGWRGKVALRWCLGSYVILFLAYFGTQFVLEFILKRS